MRGVSRLLLFIGALHHKQGPVFRRAQHSVKHLTIRNLLSGPKAMTPVEIEQKMDELAFKYVEAHDPDMQYGNFISCGEPKKIRIGLLNLKMSKSNRRNIRVTGGGKSPYVLPVNLNGAALVK
jgi:hypothetical protein